MSKTLRYILGCYRALLWFYPPDLRRKYGNEMADIFEQLLQTEWTRRGARGVAATGCRAIGELFTIAVPRQLLSQWMIVTGLSLAISSGILVLLVGIMMRRGCL
jgi:hypothetical protein